MRHAVFTVLRKRTRCPTVPQAKHWRHQEHMVSHSTRFKGAVCGMCRLACGVWRKAWCVAQGRVQGGC